MLKSIPLFNKARKDENMGSVSTVCQHPKQDEWLSGEKQTIHSKQPVAMRPSQFCLLGKGDSSLTG
jgi:hypothetical protein